MRAPKPRATVRIDERAVAPAFGALAFLYGPADPDVPWEVADVGPDWRTQHRPGPATEVVIWGRIAENRRPGPASIRGALARELALARLRARPSDGFHVAAVDRLPPVRRPGPVRRAIRTALLGGLVVELVRDVAPRRVIDAVGEAAGSVRPVRLRPSGDGSALARLRLADGPEVELRVARAGHPKDPERGRAALEALEAAGIEMVPRLVDAGQTAGATWTTESILPGGHAARLTPGLLEDLTELSARLPASSSGPTAIDDQLAAVSAVFPWHGPALRAVATAAGGWAVGRPGVLLHGDLWLNNLLVRDGRLSGLFDWDTWHPSGVAGTDLLNLLADEERRQSRRDVGPLLIADFWRSPKVIEGLAPYMRTRGLPFPDAAGLAAIAVGWWASRVAAALDRGGRPTTDPVWVRQNVDDVLDWLEDLIAELG